MGFLKTKICALLLTIIFIDAHWLYRVTAWQVVLLVAVYFDELILCDLFGVYAWHGATLAAVAFVNVADVNVWLDFIIPIAFALRTRQFRVIARAFARIPLCGLFLALGAPAWTAVLAYYSAALVFYELYQ